MTPKEKSKEFIKKFKALTKECDCLEYTCICFRIGNYDAKRCALISVEELIKETSSKYWYDVKKELEKL
jgi:hypothetical protein